jgi:putative FmdB family regulatory protein
VPIYEYRCNHCEHRLEMLQKISDDPAKTCPACGEDSLRKLVSAAAFKLKGTGWYETDFKDKKPNKDAKTSKGNEADNKKIANSNAKKSDNSSTTSESSKAAASSSSSG